ncbi:NADH-ubiquinone oxidoreductase chain 4L [Intrasporangium oryzae NRRL B-24470]|uniref:NADH-quinone oxidoreductase subunit K n=1 Tax=Intrasporangium oryzae NRRL B-24470 TaxID=1386089 RepID=W9G479_9MICO|nr:NADH-ubiquinone oxidoreductase chain 4L [Intrasporangium oryzae NRRL B-24470]
MDLQLPALLSALLAGIGVYGVLARRNAVLVLIGVELILNAANLLLVTAGSRPGSPLAAGPVLTLFVITIAAAEVCVALAVVLVMFRRFGHIDLTAAPDLSDEPEPVRGDHALAGPEAGRTALDVAGHGGHGGHGGYGAARADRGSEV